MMSLFGRIFACIALLVMCVNSYGQDFPMLHYRFEDGLPSNTVYSVYKDSKDFLWIATDKGIARYNGIKFEVFTMSDGLPDNEIYFFKEDHDGRLWLATSNGKLCFYKNDTFHTGQNTPYLKLATTEEAMITMITNEYDSSVTFIYYNQDAVVNICKNKISESNIQNLFTRDILISNFYRKKVGPDRYNVFFRNGNIVADTACNVDTVIHRELDWSIRYFFSQDQEYMASDKFIYNADREVIRPFVNDIYKKNHFYQIYNDGSNFFYPSTNGLFMNDTVTIIKDMDVSSITQDVLGNYWVGTLNDGLLYIRKDFLSTRVYNDVYPGKIRYCKSVGSHILYTTTDNNLYDLQNGNGRPLFDYRKFKKEDYSLENDAAYYIDSNYNYYNVYFSDNILGRNILSGRPVIHRYGTPFRKAGVKAILTNDKNMFLKTRDHMYFIDFVHLRNKDTISYRTIGDSALYDRIFGFTKDAENTIWYSTIKRMYKIQELESIEQPQFNGMSLKSFEFLGKYMVGYTFDNRLMIFSSFNETVTVDSTIPNHCVWDKLYKLNDSTMLISTNNFDRLLTIHDHGSGYTTSLSVIEDPFVPLNIEAFCADDSICYFFKNGSVTTMSIGSLLKKYGPPKLYFSLMKTARQTYYITKEIAIPYKEMRNISISFATSSFGGKDVFYQYSVSKTGHDVWRDVQGEEINLVNPGYGYYTIKVRAKTLDSGYSEPIVFTLHILRPYWATWWFITLCIGAGLAIAGLAVRLRILYLVRKNRKEHDTEMKFVKSEYKALNALMNPHFIFNTLNNVQSLFNANDKLAANEYLRIFADLIRQNMHNVSKELIPLQKEIALVMNYLMLEKLRFEDKLNYQINVDEDIDLSDIMVPPLLIQPLVENSIKHGILPLKNKPGIVHINVSEREGMLRIEVKDNGVGIVHAKGNADAVHESFGMENIRKRIAQLSIIQNKEIGFNISEINDEAGKHLWTVAAISMPISE